MSKMVERLRRASSKRQGDLMCTLAANHIEKQDARLQALEAGLSLLLRRVVYADDRIAWESVGLTNTFSDELESVIQQCRNLLGDGK